MFTDFVGRAKRIENIDIPRIGRIINVGEDELHALMDVETTGSGFDRYGRPKALYEPHRAYRNSSGHTRQLLVNAGLAYERWGEKPYPKDSYPRIKEAMKIDRDVALMSTSWGLGQILAENYMDVGYDTPSDMVLAFMDDEENHLEAMVRFLIANNIDDDLAAHRWAVVARVYNGPKYAVHQYDVRLERAYAKWAKIPDTPFEGGTPIVVKHKDYQILRRGMKGGPVVELQRELQMEGFKLKADGDFGARTEGQVKLYQARKGLTVDGIVGPATWEMLTN
jgi:hypothetical protein